MCIHIYIYTCICIYYGCTRLNGGNFRPPQTIRLDARTEITCICGDVHSYIFVLDAFTTVHTDSQAGSIHKVCNSSDEQHVQTHALNCLSTPGNKQSAEGTPNTCCGKRAANLGQMIEFNRMQFSGASRRCLIARGLSGTMIGAGRLDGKLKSSVSSFRFLCTCPLR